MLILLFCNGRREELILNRLTSNTIIIHHDDLDGYIGGCVLKSKNINADTLCLNYDNVEKIPDKNFFKNYDKVFIVDYSFKPELMLFLKKTTNVIWIDHHISAIKDSKDFGYDSMPGLRKINYCGAELAWKYSYVTPIPKFIKMVGEFDTFRNANQKDFFNNQVMTFFYGCQSQIENFNPKNINEEDFIGTVSIFSNDQNVERAIRTGEPIFNFLKTKWKESANKNSFVRNIWGYNVLCLNNSENGSMQLDEAFNPELHDIMLKFHYNGKNWCYGLYTKTDLKPNLSVGEIAKSFGGGGHQGAAGFTTDYLLEELEELI